MKLLQWAASNMTVRQYAFLKIMKPYTLDLYATAR